MIAAYLGFKPFLSQVIRTMSHFTKIETFLLALVYVCACMWAWSCFVRRSVLPRSPLDHSALGVPVMFLYIYIYIYIYLASAPCVNTSKAFTRELNMWRKKYVPSGNPSMYYPKKTMLNFRDRFLRTLSSPIQRLLIDVKIYRMKVAKFLPPQLSAALQI